MMICSKIGHTTQFYKTDGNDDLNIRSVFFKEKYQIGFDSEALEFAHPFQIAAAAYHESRHAFQWQIINGLYTGEEKVELSIIKTWEKEFFEYTSPSNDVDKEKEYLFQEIEKDAISFSYNQWKGIIDDDILIPKSFKNDVIHIK